MCFYGWFLVPSNTIEIHNDLFYRRFRLYSLQNAFILVIKTSTVKRYTLPSMERSYRCFPYMTPSRLPKSTREIYVAPPAFLLPKTYAFPSMRRSVPARRGYKSPSASSFFPSFFPLLLPENICLILKCPEHADVSSCCGKTNAGQAGPRSTLHYHIVLSFLFL